MTKQIEAMKLALEALEWDSDYDKRQTARAALREALAAPVQQDWEAVAADQAMTIALLRAEQPAQQTAAIKTLKFLGYTYHGGEQWKPPLGKQPAQQEPVAWQVEMFIAGEWVPLGNPQRSKTKAEALASNPALPKEHQRLFPVYTSPPAQRKPLTDEVKDKFWIEAIKHGLNGQTMNWQKAADFYAHAIEAAHGIKGDT